MYGQKKKKKCKEGDYQNKPIGSSWARAQTYTFFHAGETEINQNFM